MAGGGLGRGGRAGEDGDVRDQVFGRQSLGQITLLPAEPGQGLVVLGPQHDAGVAAAQADLGVHRAHGIQVEGETRAPDALVVVLAGVAAVTVDLELGDGGALQGGQRDFEQPLGGRGPGGRSPRWFR
jgi:hypothetical protein